ncbi:hypothetical protein EVAR_18720_1 [Eumeta japonica]|uniref:Uncharacterized protein n=1 Tax=Eumeta variegata TaxID=151549 RepID=A0A4C1UN70_EUMVA|nr:hypothetical protein EVAR_18720_1 [Eumeta japonica]
MKEEWSDGGENGEMESEWATGTLIHWKKCNKYHVCILCECAISLFEPVHFYAKVKLTTVWLYGSKRLTFSRLESRRQRYYNVFHCMSPARAHPFDPAPPSIVLVQEPSTNLVDHILGLRPIDNS